MPRVDFEWEFENFMANHATVGSTDLQNSNVEPIIIHPRSIINPKEIKTNSNNRGKSNTNKVKVMVGSLDLGLGRPFEFSPWVVGVVALSRFSGLLSFLDFRPCVESVLGNRKLTASRLVY